MNNSETSFQQPPPKISKALVLVFLFVALIGLADASYLTAEHYLGNMPKCAIFTGCATVAQSPYATVGPIPLALIGALYYLTIFFLSIAYLDSGKEKILKLAAYLTIGGFAASLFFVYLQIFVIRAICLYCMISALASITLFIIGLTFLRRLR